jgi:hypothetical protein
VKPLSQLTTEDISKIKLVSFDADGVAIEKGTQVLEKDGQLTVKSKVISDHLLEKIGRLKNHFRVNISSGRNTLYLNYMFGRVLWNKASLQGENGLLTLVDGQVLQPDKLTVDELDKLERIKAQIVTLSRTSENIKGFEPKQFIISVHCHKPDPEIERIVKESDTNLELAINWVSNEAYDIYLKRFNKGTGLKFLCSHLGISTEEVLAIGNDPNDRYMTDAAGIGVTTDREHLEAHYYTEGKMPLGGEELVDRLLEVMES